MIALAVAVPATTSSVGAVTLGLVVPDQQALLGAELACQGYVVDPAAPLGWVLTNGVSFILGE